MSCDDVASLISQVLQSENKFVHNADEGWMEGCRGMVLLPATENAVLAFLFHQHFKNPSLRFHADEIEEEMRYLYKIKTIYNAVSELNKRLPVGEGYLEQACGSCISIAKNTSSLTSRGYGIIIRVPVLLIRYGEQYPLLPKRTHSS